MSKPEADSPSLDFIRTIITKDVRSGKHGGKVRTRFPPEPNGYLHIGHPKSICLNFGVAAEFGGLCNLRFDDTNPEAESIEFAEAIERDVKWLGFDWEDRRFHASAYYPRYYEYAVQLVNAGKAYVCGLDENKIREYRGTVTEPGRDSPDRHRPIAESLDLLGRMKAGEFADGSYTLRAKIDMAHPNMKLRDPLMYRIRREADHYRTGREWKIYPMYDFAHCLGDSLEGITHSLCTLEFENNRALYDWYLDALGVECHPQQIEFARLNISHTVTSKRKLAQLVEEGRVRGWDDPRMSTIAGVRRLGYPPAAIRKFCETVGVAKRESLVDIAQLEFCVREDLNLHATRVMAVLHPLKLVIDNYPEGKVEEVDAINNPEEAAAGSRTLPFSRELWIEQDDFREEAPKKYFRLMPGREVRLKHAYFVTCTSVVKDAAGIVTEVHCTYDPETRGGAAPDGRNPRSTMHWVSAAHAVDAEVRLYDRLFTAENPGANGDWLDDLNPDSLTTLTGCKVEPSLSDSEPGSRYQFLRQGYFCTDPESSPGRPVFNRTVGLRDTWAKVQQKG